MNVRFARGASLLGLILAVMATAPARADDPADEAPGKGAIAKVTSADLVDLRKKVLETIVAAEDAPDLEARLKEVLEEFADKHNPPTSTLYRSEDFVLCVAHGGGPNENGGNASVSDSEAALVIAIGGRGGDSATGRIAKAGNAKAHAERGIAIAIPLSAWAFAFPALAIRPVALSPPRPPIAMTRAASESETEAFPPFSFGPPPWATQRTKSSLR